MPLTIEEENCTFLTFIKQNKDMLFSSYSNVVTKEEKVKTGKGIIDDCVTIYGFNPFPEDKGGTYIGDTIWPNGQKGTISKRNSFQKTGAKGGSGVKYSKLENLMLNIIRRDLPAVKGLNIAETWEDKKVNMSTNESMDRKVVPLVNELVTISHINSTKLKRHFEFVKNEVCQNEIDILKREKLQLEIEELKKKNLNGDLQNRKLELEIQSTLVNCMSLYCINWFTA